jgi:hypothetical protein
MMKDYRRMGASALGALVLLILGTVRADAAGVSYTVAPSRPGMFKYNLVLNNDSGAETLSGLNVLDGNSVFGLDGSSDIGAPPGWEYFAPLGPVNDLNYFSMGAATDVTPGEKLSGFYFQSATPPSALEGGTFRVEGIGYLNEGDDAAQIEFAPAVVVPEPTSVLVLIVAVAAMLAWCVRSAGAGRSSVPRQTCRRTWVGVRRDGSRRAKPAKMSRQHYNLAARGCAV